MYRSHPSRHPLSLPAWCLLLSLAAMLAIPRAHAAVCDSPVRFAKDAKLSTLVHSNACTQAGNLLSSVAKSALKSVLATYGIPGFTTKDPFAKHVKAIISEIQATRRAVIDEVDALWDELRKKESALQAASYRALLDRTGGWSDKSLTAKLASASELDLILQDLVALEYALAALITEEGRASGENPTALTRYGHIGLLHVFMQTVDLRAAIEIENVHLDELAGKIGGCANDPRVNSDVARLQVQHCLDLLSPAAREELEASVHSQGASRLRATLAHGFDTLRSFSDGHRVLQTVARERFALPSGTTSGGQVDSLLLPGPDNVLGAQTWGYTYAGQKFTITKETSGHSSNGTNRGYRASFDGREYGSPEEVFETHRRRVYHEMLWAIYVPERFIADHWWEQLRASGLASGYRPRLALDAEVEALALGQDAPGYTPAYTSYATISQDGVWKPVKDQDYGAQAISSLTGGVSPRPSAGEHSLLVSASLNHGTWYAPFMLWGMNNSDPLHSGEFQPWEVHRTLLLRQTYEGRVLSTSDYATEFVPFYKGQFAAKFIALR